MYQVNFGQKTKLYNGDFGGLSYFKTYTADDGLALSGIASSLTDRFGNLWFGTYGGGVTRYDGKTFTTFSTANGLAGNVVLCMLEDSKGNLWFGTNRRGITKYDGLTFTSYNKTKGLENNSILSIAEDKNGNLWFGTYGGGVSKYDGNKFITLRKKDGLASDVVRSIYIDKKNRIWFGTIGGGISIYDGKKFETVNVEKGLAGNDIFSITEDNLGKVWIGTMGGGICSYDGKTFTKYQLEGTSENTLIWCSYKDKLGNLWFGTRGAGAIRYDGKNFSKFTIEQGLPNNYVFSITEDRSGHIWFGTHGGGICNYQGSSLISYTVKQGLAADFVFSILQDKEGNYWFGTYGNGISKLDWSQVLNGSKTIFKNYNVKNGLAYNDVKSIYEDCKGNIWFGTNGGGISKLTLGNSKFINYTVKEGLADDRVNCIHEDKSGSVWFGTAGGGISKFNGSKFITYTTRNGLNSNTILSMIEDSKGNLWFTTANGVTKYDGKIFKNFTEKDGLIGNYVFSVCEDRNGSIWFGTDGNGINKYDGHRFYNYTTKNGLSDNTVGQILEDKEGRIFFATNQGLSVLVGWTKREPIFEIYNQKTGYSIRDVNAGQKGMLLDKYGVIWIGNGDNKAALIRFDYKSIKRNENVPSLFIQNIKVNERNIDWREFYKTKNKNFVNTNSPSNAEYSDNSSIEFDGVDKFYSLPQNLVLPHNKNHLTFEFAAITPSNPNLVNYQYKLEGYDDNWGPVTKQTAAVYGNIFEGNYTFCLRAQSPEGKWTKTIYYSFKVLSPWYRTIYAFIFYGLMLVLIVYLMMQQYSRNLRKRNLMLEELVTKRTQEITTQNDELKRQTIFIQEQAKLLSESNASKDKFFRIIAHDLRSPISSVLTLTEIMSQSGEEMPPSKLSKYSKNLYSSVANLYQLMNNLLDWATTQQGGITIDKKEYDIYTLIEENLNLIQDSARQKEIEIINHANKNTYVMLDEKMVNTVLRNLLSNALKFTERGGRVEVETETLSAEKMIMVKISDNGIGISESELPLLFKLGEKTGRKGTSGEPTTGLGLILCKEFIELHGGEMFTESRTGVGSRFFFTLPIS